MQDFYNMFSNLRNEQLRHFDVLNIKVILFLMHFEFRHIASKLIWKHYNNNNIIIHFLSFMLSSSIVFVKHKNHTFLKALLWMS